MKPLKILAIGHSYSVGTNRSIMEKIGSDGRIDLTVAAPEFFHGDLRPIHLEQIERSSYRLVGLPAKLTHSIHLFYYQKLQKLFNEPWDLVHMWEEPYIVAGAQIAYYANRRKIPYSFFSCQNINKKYPLPFRIWESYIAQTVSGWAGCGHLVIEALEEKGFPKSANQVLPLGVSREDFFPSDIEKKTIRNQLGLLGDVIGFIGRLTPDKGIPTLMHALSAVSKPWTLLILGSGPLEEDLNEWQKSLPIHQKVVIKLARHDEMRPFINAMDFIVAPSQTMPHWREQFGRMIVESFACKKAVIGSNSGEIPLVIGECGVIVDEKSPSSWAHAIEDLLIDEAKRNSLGEAGYSRFKDHFEANAIAQSFIEFFVSIKNSKNPASFQTLKNAG